MSSDSSSRIVRFGVFEVDLSAGDLRRSGLKVKLQEQPLQVLAVLLEHPGEVVTREELRTKLWPADTFVDFDHGLNAAIKRLRDALGESADAPVFIETLARRGYRFIAPVNGSSAQKISSAVSGASRARTKRWMVVTVGILVILSAAAAAFFYKRPTDALTHTGIPNGWLVSGETSTGYDSGIDLQAAYHGHPSAYLKPRMPVEGYGTLMQQIRADHYLGKRVRFSGFLKTERAGWSALWMRVDGPHKLPPDGAQNPQTLAFDNMHNRPIQGTTDWREYDLVLDVPQEGAIISFGVLLAGSGTVWVSDLKFEVVGLTVPTTSEQGADTPMNLDFDKK